MVEKTNTYVCWICKRELEFDEEWTDDDATKELKENFPGTDVSECNIVCDDCYQIAMNITKSG